jgi:hypothetical protein
MKQNKKALQWFKNMSNETAQYYYLKYDHLIGKDRQVTDEIKEQIYLAETAAPLPYTGEGVGITQGKWRMENPENKNSNFVIYTTENTSGLANVYTGKESEANAKAICTAVNETYGKGYDPAAMGELVEALLPFVMLAESVLKDTLKTSESPLYGYNETVLYVKDLVAAKAALLKAKLNNTTPVS